MPDNSLTWVNITAAARGVDTVQRFRDYRRAMEVHSRGLGEALMTPIIFFTFDFPMGNAGFFTPQKYWAAFPMWSKFEALYPGDVFLPLHNLPPADYTGDFDSRRRDLFCDEDEHRTYTARVPAGPWNIYERPIRPEAVRVRSETVETFAKLVVHELNVVYTAPKRSFIMYLAEHHDKWREYMRSILQLESVVADEGRPHDMVVITGGAFADKWAVTVGDVPEGMEPDTNSADLGEKMGLKDYVDSVNNARYCWHGLVFVRYFKVLDRKTYKKYGKMPAVGHPLYFSMSLASTELISCSEPANSYG
ncbi:hypothetical protein BDW22DRAFT_1165555 [Trametopsis cervina]|nr:hypothetical protein BDW22DRAFT_1165555 [Trametopsis cervina]